MRAAAPTSSDPPVNTPTGVVAVEQQERQVLGGVAGRGQRAQRQPAQVDLVAVVQAAVCRTRVTGRRGEHRRAVVGAELVRRRTGSRRAGGCPPRTRSAARAAPRPPHRPQVTARVHDQGPPVTEVHQVGAVAQALVDQRNQINSSHGPFPACDRRRAHSIDVLHYSKDDWRMLYG